eukprot:gene16809-22292_t
MPDIEQPINQSKKEYEMISKNATIHPFIESSKGGMQLQWNNIIYKVNVKNEDSKAILQGVSGTAYPGELLAILGTSGAGKTTLLDVLSSRLVSKGLSGLITSNGNPIDKKSFRRESGYVKQSDALFPFLTVKETVRFASYLRIPNKTRAEKNEIADNTIKLLHLDDCEDTIVGDEQNKGISGGQKRRVSIAVDIIHQPKAIFLDEPTSGLDSSTAYSVVNSLHQIAQVKFSTIIMTIHQPSARIFQLLDKVMFLSNGRVTYDGLGINLQSYVSKIYTESGFGGVPLAQSFVTAISTIVPDPMIGQTAGSAIFSVMFVFSGVETNAQVLASFSETDVNRWTGVGILIAWALFYRGVFYYRLITAFNGSKK